MPLLFILFCAYYVSTAALGAPLSYFGIPVAVQIRGRFAAQSEEIGQTFEKAFNLALELSSHQPAGSALLALEPESKRIRFLITNEAKPSVGSQVLDLEDYRVHSMVSASGDPSEEISSELTIGIRWDQVLFDRSFEPNPDGFSRLVASLYSELSGSGSFYRDLTKAKILAAASDPKLVGSWERHMRLLSSSTRIEFLGRNPTSLPPGNRLELLGAMALIHLSQSSAETAATGLFPVKEAGLVLGSSFPPKMPAGAIEAAFSQALYLVQALPPVTNDSAADPFVRERGERVFDKVLSFGAFDSRGGIPKPIIPSSFLVEGQHQPSDTALLDIPRNPQLLQTVVFTEAVAYDPYGAPRPDAVLRMAAALAGDFYGVYPKYLRAEGPPKLGGDPIRDSLRLRDGYLNHATALLHRLERSKEHLALLGEGARKWIPSVRTPWKTAQEQAACVWQLLKKRR